MWRTAQECLALSGCYRTVVVGHQCVHEDGGIGFAHAHRGVRTLEPRKEKTLGGRHRAPAPEFVLGNSVRC